MKFQDFDRHTPAPPIEVYKISDICNHAKLTVVGGRANIRINSPITSLARAEW